MKKMIWRYIGLGAAISLMLVYFIELTSSGLQKIDGTKAIEAAYKQAQLKQEQATAVEIEEQINVGKNESITPVEQEIARLEAEILELKKQSLQKEKKQLEQMLLNDAFDESNVNKLADTTSGALQQLSSNSMQFVAELFHKVIN